MRFGIFGAGGFGREVAPVARERMTLDGDRSEIVFISDFAEPITNGLQVLKLEDLTNQDRIVIAVADQNVRRALALRCEDQAVPFGSIVASTHVRYDDVLVGAGSIFCNGTIVTSNVRIGNHFHCNLNGYVAHDCRIGDFVTFAPNVCCNGNVTVEDDVYVGTGAIIKPGVTLGARSVVGMGAVVTKDVSPETVVMGNPARPR